jgi:H+/Cl- antiporter ClcA
MEWILSNSFLPSFSLKVCASQFSILGGGSLGPEAPLVAICASLGGFISRSVFGVTNRNLVRKHTLMGMAGALAAFFGCPLGGSLFAMEVNSRFGIEYFEHTVEAIFAGEVCLVFFRGLSNLPIEPIWEISLPILQEAKPIEVIYGLVLGLIGALAAYLFAQMHMRVMKLFHYLDLIDRNERAVYRALLGCSVVVVLAMLVPHTMFWGEYEFQTIATMSPASTLDHIWPTYGLFHFEMTSAFTAFIVGVTKLIAISFTVAGGYRGGYIFPAMAAGAAFGQSIHYAMPFIPVQLCVLCMAGAINTAITRTSIATALILAYLAGEQNAISAILASCLVSLFVTAYMPFIKTQMVRADMDCCLYQNDDAPQVEADHHETV